MNPGDKVKTSLGPGIVIKQEVATAGLVRSHQRYLVKVNPLIKSTYFQQLQAEYGGLYFQVSNIESKEKPAKQIGLHF